MYEVLCFTETWLTKDHKIEQYVPSIFIPFCANRSDTNSDYCRGGGVAILVHKRLKSMRLSDYENDQIESICVKISVDNRSFVIYLAYVPPYSDCDVFDKHVNCIQNILCNVKLPVIVVGDFNLSKVKWERSPDGNFYLPYDIPTGKRPIYDKFMDQMMLLSLYQVCNVKNDHDNVLDLVFSCDFQNILIDTPKIAVTETDRIDKAHPPIEILYDCVYVNRGVLKTKEVYLYNRGNYAKMCRELESVNFQHEFLTRTNQESFVFLCEVLHRCVENNVPKKIIKCNSNPKWWDRDMLRLKNRRNKAWKTRHTDEDKYYQSLREFNERNKVLFDQYLASIQGKICTDPKYFWSYVKERNSSNTIPKVMRFNDQIADSTQAIVNLFADSFEGMFDADDTEFDLDAALNVNRTCLYETALTLDDIDRAIRLLKSNGSKGPDDIHPTVVRKCSAVLVWPIWLLFKKTFDSGHIPDAAKMSRIIPIHKKKDKSDVANYRMIAIGSVLLRIMEKAVFEHMASFIESKLVNEQHGFRRGRSVSTNLLNLSIAANRAFARRSQLDVFYGDFRTAFDRVCHRILFQKLIEFGIGIKTVRWIASFVQGRRNYVDIEGTKSRFFTSLSGVGAGTTLGPALFLIFINDIGRSIRYSDFLLFADDIKIFTEVPYELAALDLQNDINAVQEWCVANRLHFNIDKCNVISLSKISAPIIVNYTLAEQLIMRVEEIRDLGITIDCRFRFVSHIQKTIASARQTIGFIKRISSGQFDQHVLRLLYTAYVRSKLEFGSVLWDPYQQIYRDEIESVQKGFLIYLLGDAHRTQFRLAPYCERSKMANLPSLASRRLEMKLMLGYDILKGIVGDGKLSDHMTICRPNRHLRSIRLLVEKRYASDYLYWQPIAWIVRLLNAHGILFSTSQSRIGFRNGIRDAIFFTPQEDDLHG